MGVFCMAAAKLHGYGAGNNATCMHLLHGGVRGWVQAAWQARYMYSRMPHGTSRHALGTHITALVDPAAKDPNHSPSPPQQHSRPRPRARASRWRPGTLR